MLRRGRPALLSRNAFWNGGSLHALRVGAPLLHARRGLFHRYEVPVPTKNAVGTWVSDVYPMRHIAPLIDGFRWLLRLVGRDFTWHEDRVLEELKRQLEASGVEPCDYFPRFKEGGVLVYFRDLVSAQQAISYFHTNKFRGWKRKVYLVEGTPWLEDMLHHKPSFKLKV
jgi:hypothetical protein